MTFVEYRGCDYKGTKMEENQGQGFLSYVTCSVEAAKRLGIGEKRRQKAVEQKE